MKLVKYLFFILFLSSCIHDNSEAENNSLQDYSNEVNYRAPDYYVNYDSKGNEQSNLFSNLNSSISSDLQGTNSKSSLPKNDENKAYDNIYFGISPKEYKDLDNNYRVKIGDKSYPVYPIFHNDQLFNLTIEIPVSDVSFILNIIEEKFGKATYRKYEHEEFDQLDVESYSWTTKSKKIILSHNPDNPEGYKAHSLFLRNPYDANLVILSIPLSDEHLKATKKLQQENIKNSADKF